MADIPKLDAHLFVCTNTKANGESCGPKGAAGLRDRLKAACADPALGWKGRVRINNSGCLGHCERGIAAVLYPQGRWWTELKADDVDVLKSALHDVLDKKN